MTTILKLAILGSFLLFLFNQCRPLILPDPSTALFQYSPNASTRWISFENPRGLQSEGGKENHGAKGHPCDDIPAHSKIALMEYQGSGIIQRIWLTISDRSVYMCRGLVINMYWDGDTVPAVSAPIGDFFGLGFERNSAFENELFTSGEGRSFVCHIPMPFVRSARIEVVNETDRNLDMIFYEIDLQSTSKAPDRFLYFHGYWHRENCRTVEL